MQRSGTSLRTIPAAIARRARAAVAALRGSRSRPWKLGCAANARRLSGVVGRSNRGAVRKMGNCWLPGVALRGEASSRLMLRWLKTVVVSDEEKARVTGQAGTGKASVSEPLMTCRDQIGGIGTGASQ